jgi:hypothetical protein
MKKWIPYSIYCDDCPFWHSRNNYPRNKAYCDFRGTCEDDCDTCNDKVSYCEFLNYYEVGDYPLGDGCKVCGIKEDWSR